MLAILAVLTAGIWWPYTERIRSKMEGGKIAGSLTRSRDDLWDARMTEFKGFPIFGVGFATVKSLTTQKDKQSKSGDRDYWNRGAVGYFCCLQWG